MNTTCTSGQLSMFLKLMEQKGMTPEKFQKYLEKGMFADLFELFDPGTVQRDSIRKGLNLPPNVKPWVNIFLGTNKSRMDLLNAVAEKYIILDSAYSTFEKLGLYPGLKEKTPITLYCVRGYELGINSSETYEKISEIASENGLTYCHEEVIPQLRWQYKQSNAEPYKKIATKPFDNEGCPSVFSLDFFSDRPGLSLESVHPQEKFNPSEEWIFS